MHQWVILIEYYVFLQVSSNTHWVLCFSSGFKEWNHGWKIRSSHGWHHHPPPHQNHHFFTHHPHCYTHFCRYSFPHYSMMIIMIVIWGENWSLQVLFLSLTTLLTSSIATSPRVSSPTINSFKIWSQVDFAISALTGWILIHYLFIPLAVAASGFLLAHRWIFSQHRLHPHPGQASLPGRFSKGALDHLREVLHLSNKSKLNQIKRFGRNISSFQGHGRSVPLHLPPGILSLCHPLLGRHRIPQEIIDIGACLQNSCS